MPKNVQLFDGQNLPGEIWVAVENYEGLYEVSNMGRVRSMPRVIKRKSGRLQEYPSVLLKGGYAGKGYRTVILCKDQIQNSHKVSRLVASAFIPNPDGRPEVNHKDGNKKDNSISNLEWSTHQENCLHRSRILKKNAGAESYKALFTREQVIEMRALYAAGGISYSDVARKYGHKIATVYGILVGRSYRFL